jgi:hypothetical protein
MIVNEQNFLKGTAHAAISETSGRIFSLVQGWNNDGDGI